MAIMNTLLVTQLMSRHTEVKTLQDSTIEQARGNDDIPFYHESRISR